MEAWQTILLAFGGNAALIAILAFLSKSLIEKLIVRDTKIFEANLKRTTDAEIERLRNEMGKNLESHKVRLKKSEVFFLRELDAASAFTALFRSIHPTYSHPTMDWSDACDAIAQDFGRIEARLDEFMAKHGAMLDDDERSMLIDSIADAGSGKFEVDGGSVSAEAHKKADEVYETLKALEARLMKRLRAQAAQ
jgi:hypothetical protein